MSDIANKITSLWDSMDLIENLVKEWKPKGCETKKDYEKSLSNHLKKKLEGKEITQKFTTGKSKVDLAIDKTIFIKIEKDLKNTGKLKRLIGQIENYTKDLNHLILILCGEMNKDLLKQLRKKVISFFEFNCRIFEKGTRGVKEKSSYA